MAPKKRVLRTVKETNNNSYKDLTLNNVLCPICRNIFIEPVTLPCSHGFCLNCFEGTVANANLTCPLCRVRFGSWHRIAKKENRVVNTLLWIAVQKSFPDQVKNRLEGIEENLDKDSQFVVCVASPGAVRKEYEAQKKKEEAQLRLEREAEEKASKLLIDKLKEQDAYEELLREEKEKLDAQMAQKIAKEINILPNPPTNCAKWKGKSLVKNNTLDSFLLSKQNNAQVVLNPLQINLGSKNLIKRNLNTQNDECLKSGSNDSSNDSNKYGSTDSSNTANEIDGEFKFFKPINPAKTTIKMSPLKVPVKPKKIATIIYGSPPKGNRNVCRAINSAFVYFKPQIRIDLIDISYHQSVLNSKQKMNKSDQQRKVKTISHLSSNLNLSRDIVCPPAKRQCFANESTKSSITSGGNLHLTSDSIVTQASCSTWNQSRSNSPFLGFVTPESNSSEKNNVKEMQEKQDREFALRLHEELNSNSRLNRMRTINSRRKPRQAKLEELVKPINAKY